MLALIDYPTYLAVGSIPIPAPQSPSLFLFVFTELPHPGLLMGFVVVLTQLILFGRLL
ncbi:hypothetical protein BDW42DRAFT_173762 [Aspergillus taichungensis]|uniref:Uncharacterized protein n=1 Tax=Aspergillus taichungensis TaxID=482145 RepID=A0A2J5HP09_9EURO|nr:hypothetical protein BDW42DRAFT_173762 [Aspergillus taichungensis]